MKSLRVVPGLAVCVTLLSCLQKKQVPLTVTDNFILVKGGTFVNPKSNLYGKKINISDFYMGSMEVTQREWRELMGSNPSKFKGDSLPVETVSWYDCIIFCNKKSAKAGLTPYYTILKDEVDTDNKSEFDSIKWTVTIDSKAKGYRLPSEVEWEYAASGGQLSKGYEYSGSNDIAEVAWTWRNSGDSLLTGEWSYQVIESNRGRTREVGAKTPNELGLYDMTGNVREWCEDWFQSKEIPMGHFRSERGGGWIGLEPFCKTAFRDYFEASGKGPDQGLRLCRNK